MATDISEGLYTPRLFRPLANPNDLGSVAERRIAHALEEIAAALCRVDYHLVKLAEKK